MARGFSGEVLVHLKSSYTKSKVIFWNWSPFATFLFLKKLEKVFIMGLNNPLKKLFEKIAIFVIATTGASNNFGIEKWHFLRGLDTPNTPNTYESGL
jgi:hypothetical protein